VARAEKQEADKASALQCSRLTRLARGAEFNPSGVSSQESRSFRPSRRSGSSRISPAARELAVATAGRPDGDAREFPVGSPPTCLFALARLSEVFNYELRLRLVEAVYAAG